MMALSNLKRAGDGAPSALATAFAMIGDRHVLAYALRCASVALLTASRAVEALRPADGGGR